MEKLFRIINKKTEKVNEADVDFFVNPYGAVIEVYEDEDENGCLVWTINYVSDKYKVVLNQSLGGKKMDEVNITKIKSHVKSAIEDALDGLEDAAGDLEDCKNEHPEDVELLSLFNKFDAALDHLNGVIKKL